MRLFECRSPRTSYFEFWTTLLVDLPGSTFIRHNFRLFPINLDATKACFLSDKRVLQNLHRFSFNGHKKKRAVRVLHRFSQFFRFLNGGQNICKAKDKAEGGELSSGVASLSIACGRVVFSLFVVANWQSRHHKFCDNLTFSTSWGQ